MALVLAHQIRSQYTIGYSPVKQALDGSYRRVRVVAKGPDTCPCAPAPATEPHPAGSPARNRRAENPEEERWQRESATREWP